MIYEHVLQNLRILEVGMFMMFRSDSKQLQATPSDSTHVYFCLRWFPSNARSLLWHTKCWPQRMAKWKTFRVTRARQGHWPLGDWAIHWAISFEEVTRSRREPEPKGDQRCSSLNFLSLNSVLTDNCKQQTDCTAYFWTRDEGVWRWWIGKAHEEVQGYLSIVSKFWSRCKADLWKLVDCGSCWKVALAKALAGQHKFQSSRWHQMMYHTARAVAVAWAIWWGISWWFCCSNCGVLARTPGPADS